MPKLLFVQQKIEDRHAKVLMLIIVSHTGSIDYALAQNELARLPLMALSDQIYIPRLEKAAM